MYLSLGCFFNYIITTSSIISLPPPPSTQNQFCLLPALCSQTSRRILSVPVSAPAGSPVGALPSGGAQVDLHPRSPHPPRCHSQALPLGTGLTSTSKLPGSCSLNPHTDFLLLSEPNSPPPQHSLELCWPRMSTLFVRSLFRKPTK